MRMLRGEHGVAAPSYPETDQHTSSFAHAQKLWNEWEIQCLVIVSFSLQAFLLFFTGIRKRVKSRVLDTLLWLAYVSADSVAIFVLGRLTLHVNGPDQQLFLFWAPFLLLHLGGQETLTAYSMEDNTLWRRHLLTFATQVAVAIYVVRKQWHGDKQLVAPMVLMFIVGTVKYAGRIWRLMVAGLIRPGGISYFTSTGDFNLHGREDIGELNDITPDNQDENLDKLLCIIKRGFALSTFAVTMNMNPSTSAVPEDHVLVTFKHSKNRVHVAYKLAELRLSLIYDILYTKYDQNFYPDGNVVYHLLTTFCFTGTALALFARADQQGLLFLKANGADVIISYVLLVGAITLEISSIFIAFSSSYWPYLNILDPDLTNYAPYCGLCEKIPCPRKLLLHIARRLHPQSRSEWSGKLPQKNLLGTRISRSAARGVLRRVVRWITQPDITYADVSPSLKQLLLDKLLAVAEEYSRPGLEWEWDHTKFSGQWAQHTSRGASVEEEVLTDSKIRHMDFASSVILWHIVTDICFFNDEAEEESMLEIRSATRELSNYVMYLVAEHYVMVGYDERYLIHKTENLLDGLVSRQMEMNKLITQQMLRPRTPARAPQDHSEAGRPSAQSNEVHEDHSEEGCFDNLPGSISAKLLELQDLQKRWELISAVWMEMLCYMAINCEPGFHIKHLCAGGEFLTHVKMLLLSVGFPFRKVSGARFP